MPTAEAQSPPAAEYVAADLGTLPGFDASAQYTAFAMNSSNVVVGYVVGLYNGVFSKHAWVWAPCVEYGLPRETMVDLTVLAGYGGCPTCFGEAYDINDAGIVVGAQVIEPSGVTRAFIWDLSAGVSAASFLALENPGERDASAQGINNASPPTVVGYRFFAPPPPPFLPVRVEAFRWVYSSPSALTISSIHPGGAPDSRAYDINSLGEARAIGRLANEGQPEECFEDMVGGRWTLSGSGFAFSQVNESPYPIQPIHTSLHAVNNTNQSCGLLQYKLGPFCRAVALFVNAGGIMTDLGDPAIVSGLPGLPIDTQAWGMSEAAGAPGFEVNVVGDDLTNGPALFWRRDAGVWSVFQLDSRVPASAGWSRLKWARDISASGWLCGVGERSLGSGVVADRAFVSFPGLPCGLDVNADGYIGAAELALLLGAWGPCAACADCFWDLSGDCAVGAADLAVLLGQWGFCHPSACSSQLEGFASSQSSESEAVGQPSSVEMDTAITALGFDSIAELASWVQTQPDGSAWAVASVLQMLLEGGQP